jgi:hypothetical protein
MPRFFVFSFLSRHPMSFSRALRAVRCGPSLIGLATATVLSMSACAQSREADPLREFQPQAGSVEAARVAELRSIAFSYVGDDQRLAVMDPATKQLRYGPFASISPRDDLGRIRMADYARRGGRDTLGVLTSLVVYDVRRGPNVGVYQKLQLRPGRNGIYLRYDGKVGDPKQEADPARWRVFVVWERNPRDVRVIRMNRRESHAGARFSPPATARFEWRDDDEWVWIMCDLGCCHVGGGPGF